MTANRTRAFERTPAGLWARYQARFNRLLGRDPRDQIFLPPRPSPRVVE